MRFHCSYNQPETCSITQWRSFRLVHLDQWFSTGYVLNSVNQSPQRNGSSRENGALIGRQKVSHLVLVAMGAALVTSADHSLNEDSLHQSNSTRPTSLLAIQFDPMCYDINLTERFSRCPSFWVQCCLGLERHIVLSNGLVVRELVLWWFGIF